MVLPPDILKRDLSRLATGVGFRSAIDDALKTGDLAVRMASGPRTAAEQALGLTATALAADLVRTHSRLANTSGSTAAHDRLTAAQRAGLPDLTTIAQAAATAETFKNSLLFGKVIDDARRAQATFSALAGGSPASTIGAEFRKISETARAIEAYRSPARDVLDRIAGAPDLGRLNRDAGHGSPKQLMESDSVAVSTGASVPAAAVPRRRMPRAAPPVDPAALRSDVAVIASTADIGRRVRDSRHALGMTQQRFADLAGVGRRFLGELERGKASLEIGRVLAVCEAAGIKLGFVS